MAFVLCHLYTQKGSHTIVICEPFLYLLLITSLTLCAPITMPQEPSLALAFHEKQASLTPLYASQLSARQHNF